MPTLTPARRTSAHPAPRLALRRTPGRPGPAPASESLKLRVLSKWEILELLNEDFLRECREVCACAVYAERLSDTPVVASEVSQRGQRAILHSFELGQIILQLGGKIPCEIDGDRPSALEAERVAQPEWAPETLDRLRERASHLILLEEVGLSVRMFRLINDKRSQPTLESLVAGA